MISVFSPRTRTALRGSKRAKRSTAEVQSMVNDAVREGCSVRNMTRVLKNGGYTSEEVDALIKSAYPQGSGKDSMPFTSPVKRTGATVKALRPSEIRAAKAAASSGTPTTPTPEPNK